MRVAEGTPLRPNIIHLYYSLVSVQFVEDTNQTGL